MAFPRKLRDLCSPAFVYFVLSIISLIIVIVHNFGNTRVYNLGYYSAQVPNTAMVFIVKLIYILFWTWILNLICCDGHKEIAWFLVAVPFIIVFITMLTFMSTGRYRREGMSPIEEKKQNK